MSSHLKKFEQKINRKIKHQRAVADLDDKLNRTIKAQRGQAKAFRETVNNIQVDFEKLTARVEALEKKSEGK